MGRRFYTADLHFWHKNVIRYCNRPFTDLHQMHQEMIKNWNCEVQEEDEVFIVGDLSFCGITKLYEIVRQLNGDKILIRGNHDSFPRRKYIETLGFRDVLPFYREGNIFISHYPIYKGNEVDLCEREEWDKKKVITHYERNYEELLKTDCTILLHGHIHNKTVSTDSRWKHYNVGCDVNDWRPVLHEIVMEKLGEKENHLS